MHSLTVGILRDLYIFPPIPVFPRSLNPSQDVPPPDQRTAILAEKTTPFVLKPLYNLFFCVFTIAPGLCPGLFYGRKGRLSAVSHIYVRSL